MNLVDMLGHEIKCLGGIGQRQKIVKIAAIVRGPCEMLGEAARLIAFHEGRQSLQVIGVERSRSSDGKTDAMH